MINRKLIMVLLLLCGAGKAGKAQTYLYKDAISSALSVVTQSSQMIETYNHNYMIVSYGIDASGYHRIMLTKMDRTGSVYWSTDYGTTILGDDVKGLSVTEASLNGSYVYVIAGSYTHTASTSGLLLEVDETGAPISQVLLSNMPINRVIYSAAASKLFAVNTQLNSLNGKFNINIYAISTSGLSVTSTMKMTEATNVTDIRDMVDLPAKAGMLVLANRQSGTSTHPEYLFADYTFSTTTAFSREITFISGQVTAIATALTQNGAHAYIAGYYTVAGSATAARPIVFDVDFTTISTGTPSTKEYSLGGVLSSDQVIPSAIAVMLKPGSNGLMLACTRTQTSGLTNPDVITTDLALSPLSYTEQYDPASGYVKMQYNSLIKSYDYDYYMAMGIETDDNLDMISARIKYDGKVSCDNTYSITGISDNLSNASTVTPSLVSYTSTSAIISGYPDYIQANRICGCAPNGKAHVYYDNDFGLGYHMERCNKADYDATTGELKIATALGGGTSDDAYVCSVSPGGFVLSVKSYSNTNHGDEARSIKICKNGDYIIAGYRTDATTSHHDIFLMRTDKNGTLLWQHYYTQSAQTIGQIEVAELIGASSTPDIVAVTYGDQSSPGANAHDIHILRTDNTGTTVRYYKSITPTLSGSIRNYVQIRGMVATADGGFVMCGGSGHNSDFIGALVIKISASSTAPAVDWQYTFRHNTGSTNSVAFSVIEQPGTVSGTYHYVVSGYTSDANTAGKLYTFWDGLLFDLTYDPSTSTLTYNNGYRYHENATPARNVTFSDVKPVGTTDYVLTGYTQEDPATSGKYDPLIVKISYASATRGNVTFSYTYHLSSSLVDQGASIFVTGAGYLVAGILSDNTSDHPSVLSVNSSGQMGTGCHTALALNKVTESPNPVTFTLPLVSVTNTINTPAETTTGQCEELAVLCGSSIAAPVIIGDKEGIEHTTEPAEAIICYPNPAQAELNIRLRSTETGSASIYIIDMQGKVMQVETHAVTMGNNTYTLPTSNLKPGLYVVKVVENETLQHIIKFQKQ